MGHRNSSKKVEKIPSENHEIKGAETILKESEARSKVLKNGIFFLFFLIILGGLAFYAIEEKPKKPFILPTLPQMQPSKETPTYPIQVQKEQPTLPSEIHIVQNENTDLTERIRALETQNDSLRSENAALKLKLQNADEMPLLMTHLIERMYQGRPFEDALQNLLAKDPSNPFGIKVESLLGLYAASGIPTLQGLTQLFFQNAQMTEQSFYIKTRNMTWQDEILAFLKTIIRIRPQQIDATNLNGINVIFVAEDEMKNGHIEKTLALLDKLAPEQKIFMQSFIHKAKAYLIMQTLLNETSTMGE